jgi:peptide/nickel transport system permease protein
MGAFMAIMEGTFIYRRIDLAGVLHAVRKLPVVPILLLLPVVVCGIFGPLFYPHDPTVMKLSMALNPPAWVSGGDWSYFLGTDHMGRDLLSRLIEGARASLIVAVFGVGFAGIFGVAMGMIAGYLEGTIDNVIMRIVDTQMSIPAILLIILLAAVLGGGLVTIIISVSLVFWTTYARVVRGETLSIKQRDFVALAKVRGCGNIRILRKHIFPNLVNTVMVLATLQLGRAIIIEASITFLGLGIQPPATAWGLIISDGRIYMSTAWWIPTFAGVAIMITVLGANLLGDWLRDKLDPRLRQV